MLALAGVVAMYERHHRPGGAVDAGADVALVAVGAVRRVFLVAGERHHAAHRDADDVAPLVLRVRAGLAEAGDRCEDDVGLDFAEALVAEADAVEIPRCIRLDDDVGRGYELLERSAALRICNVERDAALVGVQAEEVEAAVGAPIVVPERADVAHRIAVGRLDADDVRAEIGEEFGRVYADLASEIDHADVGECGVGHG